MAGLLARNKRLVEASDGLVVFLCCETVKLPQISFGQWFKLKSVASGGGGRIRTHEPREGLTVFKTAAIDHSATPPKKFVNGRGGYFACPLTFRQLSLHSHKINQILIFNHLTVTFYKIHGGYGIKI